MVGGIVVVGSACLFGCQNFTLHFVLVFVLSLLLSLVLVSVAEIDRPFQGPVRVQADAFAFAQQTFAASAIISRMQGYTAALTNVF